MRFKKAFTLAEILIVLMVIGALATMTIPSLLKGVQEAQIKTAYRKGANTIINLATMEKVAGNLPATKSDSARVFDSLVSSLSVKGYAAKNDTAGYIYQASDIATEPSDTKEDNWIVTEDNLAYLVTQGNTTNDTDKCDTKLEILSGTGKYCYKIVVDANGLTSGPNTELTNTVGSNDKVPAIIDDRFPVYVGIDGATPGSQVTTVTGRIFSDLK